MSRLNYPNIDTDKYLIKSNCLLKEAKDFERNYISAIENANKIQNSYITCGKNTLQNFQFLEEQFIDYTQNCFRKFFVFSNSGLKNILEDNYTIQKVVEKISILDDINEYITKNATNRIPPSPIEYTPYKINIRSMPADENKLDTESMYNIVSTFYNTFEKIEGEPVYKINLVQFR
jgi:hypothetical protein